jgi:hypothetical protein
MYPLMWSLGLPHSKTDIMAEETGFFFLDRDFQNFVKTPFYSYQQ